MIETDQATPPTGRRRGRRRTVAIALVVAVLVLVTGTYAGARALGLDRLPAPTAVAVPLASDTMIYDRTDAVLLGDLHPPGYQHVEAPLRVLGRWLPAATVAADDPGFWNEPAGSTITRRLVRLRLPDAVRGAGFEAKAREAYLAARVEMTFSKSRVLELYLNALYYGHGAYGAEAAAQVYFGVGAGRLDLAQAALLAAVPVPGAAPGRRAIDEGTAFVVSRCWPMTRTGR